MLAICLACTRPAPIKKVYKIASRLFKYSYNKNHNINFQKKIFFCYILTGIKPIQVDAIVETAVTIFSGATEYISFKV